MNVESFHTAAEAAKFINDNAITAANCKIWECDGRWYVFWWV